MAPQQTTPDVIPDEEFTPDEVISDEDFQPDDPNAPYIYSGPVNQQPEKSFGENHPFIRRLFLGATNKEMGLPEDTQIQGPGLMEIPGVSKVFRNIGALIDPTDQPFYTGVRPFAAGVNQFIGDTLASGFDPRTAAVKSGRLINPEALQYRSPAAQRLGDLILTDTKNELQDNLGFLKDLPPEVKPPFETYDPERGWYNPAAPDTPATIDNAIAAEPARTAGETAVPKPGQVGTVEPDKLGTLKATFTPAEVTLGNRPSTKGIADTLITAQDEKSRWIGTTLRELYEHTKDLNGRANKQARIMLGKLLDGQEVPNAPIALQEKARNIRVILDQIHEMFPEGATRSGQDVGYLENYFTHIRNQPTDWKSTMNNILDRYFGVGETRPVGEPGTIGDFYEKGIGKPSSPYVEHRGSAPADLIYDINKVLPAYVESAAKVIWDKPAVERATAMLKDMPDSRLKELATWYIKNYSGYNSSPQLNGAWDKWARAIARTTARSVLGFNTGLQTLHLARIPANLWPELGTKYTLYGLKKVASAPIESWTTSAKLGLLQNEIKPWGFRTPAEKIDSIGNFLSFADYLDKTAGYFGYEKKFLDMGMNAEEASLRALRETKRVSQTSDAARSMYATSREGPFGPIARLGTQFKQVPARIVDQYVRIAANAKNDPRMAARMLAGIGMVIAANEGLRTFHIDPAHMIPTETLGAFGQTIGKVSYALSKGDVVGALTETALWATPAGKSTVRQLTSGLSMFQSKKK